VRLHWTTPTQTTDKLPIKGAITAQICRETLGSDPGWGGTAANPRRRAGRKAANNAPRNAAKIPCSVVGQVTVAPGATDAVDKLPAALTAGAVRLLAYRVELLNAAGRTAGPSIAVYAAAGSAPAPVADFEGSATKAGVVLRWRRGEGGPATTGGEGIELERTVLDPRPRPAAAADRNSGLPGQQKQAEQTWLRAGAGDAGGTIDRTVEIGHSYRYTAERVRSAVVVGGETVESRSVTSAAVTVAVRDVFPPDVPTGLVLAPGFEGEAQRPTIDLSWDPDVEPRVAGYRVYRREQSGVWQRVGPELVPVAAYRDLSVIAGHTYVYRITAVSTAGNESGPSGEATETAATP
jgi:hypothetical protein